jgi:hypothetical protein
MILKRPAYPLGNRQRVDYFTSDCVCMCSEHDKEETFLEKIITIPVIDNHKSMNYYFKNKLMGPEIPETKKC